MWMCVCVRSCLCEFGGVAEQVGGGHSLNEWGLVGGRNSVFLFVLYH